MLTIRKLRRPRRRCRLLSRDSLGRPRVVRFRVQTHVPIVLAVHEPGTGRRVVVDHAPDAERVHVAEAAGARLAVVRGGRLFLVIVLGQVVLETVAHERHAVVLGVGPRGRVVRHLHHLAVRGPERVRPQRLFVERWFRDDRQAVTTVRLLRVVGCDRVDVHRPDRRITVVGGRGSRCARRRRPLTAELGRRWRRGTAADTAATAVRGGGG